MDLHVMFEHGMGSMCTDPNMFLQPLQKFDKFLYSLICNWELGIEN
jgi:hypothetical protein